MNSMSNITWLSYGDFNKVHYPEERQASNFDARGAKLFNDFIDVTNLVEPSLGGRKFTWSRADGSKASKLDRFLVSTTLLSAWPLLRVVALPRLFSDHCPILLDREGPDFGLVSFKIFNSWLKSPTFKEVVENALADFDNGLVDRSPIHSLCLKLKFLKARIKARRQEAGLLRSTKVSFLPSKLSEFDLLMNLRALSELAQIERGGLITNPKELESLELVDLRQKAKIKWALEGDENSNFFRGVIKLRKRSNRMDGLITNGV